MLFTRYTDAFTAIAPWFARTVLAALCAVLLVPTCALLGSDEPSAQRVMAASFEEANETVAPAPGPVSAPAEDAEDKLPELEESLPWSGAVARADWRERHPLLHAHWLDLHPTRLPRPDARPPEFA